MAARDQRAKVDLRIYENGTFRKRFQWKQGSPATPVDLTGYTAMMQVRSKISDAIPVLNLTTANGGVVISDAANGVFDIHIADEISANICPEHKDIRGVYDLKLIAPNQPTGDGTMMLYGECYIVAAVTRGV